MCFCATCPCLVSLHTYHHSFTHHPQLALDWGVAAIHPGYGFLSENEEFCAAVEAAGIIWLGPTAKTLHDFALKHVARKIAEEAGVSVGQGVRQGVSSVG